MFFWNSLAFLMIQQMLAIWSLVPLPFLKPAWTSGSSWYKHCWSLAWRLLSINLLACEMSAIVWYLEHSLALPFFGIGLKTDLFQSCGHCWVFQICWHIECSTFTTSSSRRLITLQYCCGFCHTSTWIIHWCECVLAINFPLKMSLAASHRFWVVVFCVIFRDFFISSVTCSLFRNVLFNPHVFVFLTVFFLPYNWYIVS